MSGLNISHTTSQAIATGSGVTKTILEYTAPTNTGARIRRARITFDGVAPTGPKVLVSFRKGATTGTGTNRAPLKVSGHTGSVQGTGKENFTVEPSGGSLVHQELAHPQNGCEMAREVVLNPGETFNVATNVSTGVNASVVLDVEE